MAMMIAAFADDLQNYPGDLVISYLRSWAMNNTFWPSLSDIHVPVARETKWRESLRHIVEAPRQIVHKPRESSVWANLSPERRERVNAALRRAGVTPLEDR